MVLTGTAVIDYVNRTAIITDTTDYPGQGLLLADMTGSCIGSNINGQFYPGSPTDFVGATPKRSVTIPIPIVISTGQIPTGDYTFVINAIVSPNAAPQQTASLTITVSFPVQIPLPKLEIDFSCNAATITFSDKTIYPIAGLTLVSLSRNMLITPPTDPLTSAPVIPVINTAVPIYTVTAPNAYTNNWDVSLVTDLVYQDANGNTINIQVVGQADKTVNCSTSLCCAYECIQKALSNYRELCKGESNNITATNNLMKIFGDFMMFSTAQMCGNEDGVNTALNNMKKDLNLQDCNCGCGGDNNSAPIQIFPLIPNQSGSYITVVDNGDGNLTITNTVAGNTTTYHVNLSAAFLASIADMETDITDLETALTALTARVTALEATNGKYIVLAQSYADAVTSGTGLTQLEQYILAAATLANGDRLKYSFYVYNGTESGGVLTPTLDTAKVQMIFTGAYSATFEFDFNVSTIAQKWEITIEKISDTTIKIEGNVLFMGNLYNEIARFDITTQILTVTTLASNSLTATVKGQSVSHAAGETLQWWTVEQFKA